MTDTKTSPAKRNCDGQPSLAPATCYAAARAEITQAIIFYNGRGWDWLPLVSYLTAKATGDWPIKKMRKTKYYGYNCPICGEPIKEPQATEHTDDGLAHAKCCEKPKAVKPRRHNEKS